MHHDLLLTGPTVTLRPLTLSDAGDLADLSDAEELQWHTAALPLDEQTAADNIRRLLDHPTVQPLAVVGSDDGVLRGMTSFYDQDRSVPRVEIGHTHYGRQWWGGETNPAAKLLLLGHAFEEWGCARVALRCDAENARSRGAIERLGASYEGVLRSHRRRWDGTVADTAYFSILAGEWPTVRAGLEARLS